MSSIALEGATEARKVFATYERSVQPKQYETEKAGFIVQADIEVGADDAAVEAAAVRALHIAKANVLDQLGLEYHFDGARVVEGAGSGTSAGAVQQVTQAFPGAQVDPNPLPAPYQSPPQAALSPQAAPQPQAGGTPSCPDCSGPMWDNREGKRNPKAPDFKCKKPREECNGAIWPPR